MQISQVLTPKGKIGSAMKVILFSNFDYMFSMSFQQTEKLF